jgi:hypothetical protein
MIMKKILFILFLTFISCSEQSLWYNLKLEDKYAEINFPKKPIQKSEIKIIKNTELTFDIFTHQSEQKTSKNLAYIFITTEFPELVIDKIPNNQKLIEFFPFDSIYLYSGEMKLISEKPIKLKQREGKEYKVDYNSGESINTFRVYVNKNYLYIMVTITDVENDLNSEQEKFFNSFKIVE